VEVQKDPVETLEILVHMVILETKDNKVPMEKRVVKGLKELMDQEVHMFKLQYRLALHPYPSNSMPTDSCPDKYV